MLICAKAPNPQYNELAMATQNKNLCFSRKRMSEIVSPNGLRGNRTLGLAGFIEGMKRLDIKPTIATPIMTLAQINQWCMPPVPSAGASGDKVVITKSTPPRT